MNWKTSVVKTVMFVKTVIEKLWTPPPHSRKTSFDASRGWKELTVSGDCCSWSSTGWHVLDYSFNPCTKCVRIWRSNLRWVTCFLVLCMNKVNIDTMMYGCPSEQCFKNNIDTMMYEWTRLFYFCFCSKDSWKYFKMAPKSFPPKPWEAASLYNCSVFWPMAKS